MNNEDIMQAIEQTARLAMQDQEHMEKEAFINKMAMDTAESFALHLYCAPLILTPAMRSQMEVWAAQNRQRLSLQIEQVVRIVLRTELFP